MAVIEVIRYNGGPDILAWKYPSQELGTWTQLIVNESQAAILFKGGQALDIFESGKHTLNTANIPILNKIINLPFGGRSPFSAEVWFINKAYSLDIKWGTPTPIQIQDPKYGVFVPVRSNGIFGIQIDNPKTFMIKLVGTLRFFDRESLVNYFRGLYITKVKDTISSYLVHRQISILEINAYINELSDFMKERIEPTMQEYGIKLASFYVNDISVPEDDPAMKKLTDALSKRAEMNIIGYNYQQERSFDTLEGAAKNSGSTAAPFMGAGIGMGMGVGLGASVGGAFSGISSEIKTGGPLNQSACPNCHSLMDIDQRFCRDCGYDSRKPDQKKQSINNVCSQCGEKIVSGRKFCPECGRKYNICPDCGSDMFDDAAECQICHSPLPVFCPKCSAAIAPGKKFCPECGDSLLKKCPGCNYVIEGHPKFCPECGMPID